MAEKITKLEELTRSFDGVELYRYIEVPEPCKGIVVLLHGLGDHSRRYDDTARMLLEEGWGICRYDNRGHGRSGGARAWLDDFRKYVDDADFIISLLGQEYKDKPVFTWGYSMGGLISTAFGVIYPDKISGQVFLGTCACSLPRYKNFRRINIDKLGFNLAPSVDSELLSRNPLVCRDYDKDPLVLQAFTNRLLYEVFIKGVDWLTGVLEEHRYPSLILHGSEDKIVPIESSRNLYERSSARDKKLEILEGFYHDLLHDDGREEVVAKAVEWMNDRLCQH